MTTTTAQPDTTEALSRREVGGKFLFRGGQKFYCKDVTYGIFAKNPETLDFPQEGQAAADFMAMAAVGVNTVPVYLVAPRWPVVPAQTVVVLVLLALGAWAGGVGIAAAGLVLLAGLLALTVRSAAAAAAAIIETTCLPEFRTGG